MLDGMPASARCESLPRHATRGAWRSLVHVAALLGAGLTGCGGRLPTARVYTATGENPGSDAALRSAARDLACPLGELHVEATLVPRYDQNAALRFLIDGCGQRASYVEDCEVTSGAPASPDAVRVSDVVWCRYLLVSRVSLRPEPPAVDRPAGSPRSVAP